MTAGSASHGPGIRRYDGLVTDSRRLEWTGGGAELIVRAMNGPTEAEYCASRHAIYFNIDVPSYRSETWIDGQIFGPSTAGHVSLIPAKATMRAQNHVMGRLVYLALFIDPAWMQRSADVEHVGGCTLFPFWGDPGPLPWMLGNAISAECAAGAPHGTLYAETMATALSVHLLRHHSNLDSLRLRPARGGLAAWQLNRICDYLDARIADDITLAELARLVNLSPAHFCRAFKTSTGKTITRWRTERRIARGKELLADPRLAITDIALACGFSDHSHFGKVFREQVGVAPSFWRRERAS